MLPGAHEGVDGDFLGIGMVADDEVGDALQLASIGDQQVVDGACAASSKVSSELWRRSYSSPLGGFGLRNRRAKDAGRVSRSPMTHPDSTRGGVARQPARGPSPPPV